MIELFKAIYTKFNANDDLKNSVTGLYFIQAPQNTALPYIVYYEVSDVPTWTFNSEKELVAMHFNIFSDNRTTICNIFEKLKTCFDWEDLTLASYYHIYIKRNFANLLVAEGVFQYAVEYEIYEQKK